MDNSPNCELDIIIDKNQTVVVAKENEKCLSIFSGNFNACISEILKNWNKCTLILSVGISDEPIDKNSILKFCNFDLIPIK